MLQSPGGDLVLFMPLLDAWLQPELGISPGKKQGVRTALFWGSGCTEHRMFDSSPHFVGLDVVVVPQVTIAESVRLLSLCPSWLGGRLCPVSFPCLLSGSSCSFQSTCLYPVQFPPFPNSCSDVSAALPWCQGWVWPVLPAPGAFVMS